MLRKWRDSMGWFNFSVEHIKGKENMIADVLSRCEYKEAEIPTSEDYSPPSPLHVTTPLLPFNPPHVSHSPINKPANQTNTMPPIRTHKKAPTPGPFRRRRISPGRNLVEMWERSTNPVPQAVYTANVQTRAQD